MDNKKVKQKCQKRKRSNFNMKNKKLFDSPETVKKKIQRVLNILKDKFKRGEQ